MIFGPTPLAEAEGAVLAHSLRAGALSFKKGRRLSAADVAALRDAGLASVVAARLEPHEMGEDEAASAIAAACLGAHVSASPAFTGRCNLFAEVRGLAVIDRARVDALNLVDEAITIATLTPYEVAEAGQMAATVKIIPFAVGRSLVARATAIAREGKPLVRIAPFQTKRAGLIQTRLPGTKEATLEKTRAAIEARLEALGSRLAEERRTSHDEASLAAAIDELKGLGADPILISGASAIVDRRDVIPASIERAGGRVEHFGMPVDPGNLLLVGTLENGVPAIGLPGCARSPKFNGFDWILRRLLAEVPIAREDLARMGAGGLLAETESRGLPRALATAAAGVGPAAMPRAPKIAALLLAAGLSRRMGKANKLLAEIDGAPMVARAADAILASKASPVLVVTGHEAERVRAALAGRALGFVHNPDYAQGLASSLKRGLASLPGDVDGALICLGDMPRIAPAGIDRLIAAFNPVEGRAICVPTYRGKRGNPVLLAKRYFSEMQRLSGDTGARPLLGQHHDMVAEVEMDDDGVLIDVDSPDKLVKLRAETSVAT
ncbi:MAG TPA: molybdopterin-binding/glycosyltransferase family 2 protein [Alphaproteobacteria bacterium]|nr:molybdopterin-binding/glycosyltransferase family 2 protein [Alphaproteobacteria bacterium]